MQPAMTDVASAARQRCEFACESYPRKTVEVPDGSSCASSADLLRRLFRRPHCADTNVWIPTTRFVQVDSGVRLEVVDWGGHGAPLVFLAGAGNIAHVFDEFAPRFTNSFHVIGITRRGYGASAGALPPRDLDTLVADITRVLDKLGVGAVTLVGHSIAGEEMTRFAELHKERCAGLVYLDAAYDRTGIDTLTRLQPPTPAPRIRPADTTSFANIWGFHIRVMGVREPESEIRATNRFDEQGHFKGEVTPTKLKGRLASGPQKARYDQARCRALAIYAVPDSVPDQVPYYAELGPLPPGLTLRSP
jgi:pimeloyl-ACP methyl ester carboxylesterase